MKVTTLSLLSLTMRRYRFVLLAAFAAATFAVFDQVLGVNLFVRSVHLIGNSDHLVFDEVVFFMVLGVASLAVDQTRNARRHRERNALHKSRIQTVRATMTSVHDVVNNALNNLVLIRLEAEKSQALSPDTLAQFDHLIEDTAAKLREIDALEVVAERTLAPGFSRLEIAPQGLRKSVRANGGDQPNVLSK